MLRIFQILMIGLIGCLFLSTSAQAAANDKRIVQTSSFSITPLVGGYRYFSSAPPLIPMYGLKFSYDMIGKGTVDTLGIEATANYFSTKIQGVPGKTEGFLFRADAIYPLSKTRFVPFLAIGLGDLLTKTESGQENRPLFNYGAGLKYFFEDYLAWRIDVRHLLIYKNVDTRDNFEVSSGLTYIFGVERKQPKKQTPALKAKPDQPKPAIPSMEPELLAPALSPEEEYSLLDKLGVAGPAVAGFSTELPVFLPTPAPERSPSAKALPQAFITAPAAAPVPAQPATVVSQPIFASQPATVTSQPVTSQPVTSQPAIAQPAAVTSQPGAPQSPAAVPQSPAAVPQAPAVAPQPPTAASQPAMDAAQPPAAAQKAPTAAPQPASGATPPAPRPNIPPAAASKKVYEFTVEFDFAKVKLKPSDDLRLKKAAALIKGSRNSTVLVEGHTDSTGGQIRNLKLSRKRADAVKSRLVALGVSSAKIVTIGHGFSKPVVSNATETGRKKNRRAVTTVTIITE